MMKSEDVISFLEVSTGAKVGNLEKVEGSYLFILSSPSGQIFPPRLAELLYIDFDKREAAFTETEENISRDMEIAKISER